MLSRTRDEPFGSHGFWYRSETFLGGISLGSTYSTLAEAERDFLETILLEASKGPGDGHPGP